jgi:hypothetical protein
MRQAQRPPRPSVELLAHQFASTETYLPATRRTDARKRLQQLRLTDAKWAEVRLPDVRAGEELAVDADGWMPALAPFEVRILGPIPTR